MESIWCTNIFDFIRKASTLHSVALGIGEGSNVEHAEI